MRGAIAEGELGPGCHAFTQAADRHQLSPSQRRAATIGVVALSLVLAVAAWAAPLPNHSRVAVERASLEQILAPSGKTTATILAAFDRGGLGAAMETYRRLRSAGPKTPYWTAEAGRSSAQELHKRADVVISTGFVYGGHPAYPLALPLDWAADPFHDRSWRFWLNSLEPLEDVLAAHAATRDPRYVRFAQLVATDWLDQAEAPGNPNPFAWYDMAVGLRATRLAYLVDASARDAKTHPETMAALLRGAWKHGRHLAEERNFNQLTNHGIYQAVGLLALGTALPELRDSQQWRRLGGSRLTQMFDKSFSPEGVHLEHSFGYHLHMTRLLQAIVATGLSSDPGLADLRLHAEQALSWMVAPDGSLAALGDTSHTHVTAEMVSIPGLSSAPELLYAVTRGQHGSPPGTVFCSFPSAGFVVFRSGWPDPKGDWADVSYLALSAAFHSRTHKHADDTTFVWYDAGRWLLADAGPYGYYYAEPGRIYCESTRAHNVVEIDGADYSRLARDAFGSALAGCGQLGETYYALTSIQRRVPALTQRRALVFRPGKWLVVWDELAAGEKHRYTQWLHFAPELEARREASGVTLDLTQGKRLYVIPLAAGAVPALTLIKGQERPVMQGWYSPGQRTLAPSWAFGQTVEGRDEVLVTLLSIAAEPPQVETPQGSLAAGRIALHWRHEGVLEGFDLALAGP
jgi:hypothetical protein